MTDADLIALCAFQEANLEPDDGLAAVVQVILNRIAARYQSDGTVAGTILHGNGTAFSWAAFAMVDGVYERVANGPGQIEARVAMLLAQSKAYKEPWARAARIAELVQGKYWQGPAFAQITPDVVLYLNPALSHAAWATPDKLVTRIGHHAFYRA